VPVEPVVINGAARRSSLRPHPHTVEVLES
jgi:hypothetical protein